MPSIHVEHWGAGPPVLLVHGSVTGGAMTWDAQRPLALHWHLVVVDRRGYFPNPPDPLPPALLQNAQLLRHERLTDEARIPLGALREAPFPKLVVSGGHSPVSDAVCDVLERELEAERAVVPGAGHSVQRTGEPYNEVLHRFLTAAR